MFIMRPGKTVFILKRRPTADSWQNSGRIEVAFVWVAYNSHFYLNYCHINFFVFSHPKLTLQPRWIKVEYMPWPTVDVATLDTSTLNQQQPKTPQPKNNSRRWWPRPASWHLWFQGLEYNKTNTTYICNNLGPSVTSILSFRLHKYIFFSVILSTSSLLSMS